MKPFSPEIPNRRKHQRAFFVTWFPDVITAFSMYRFSRERPKIVLQVVIIRLPLGSRDPGDSVIIMGSSPRLLLFGRDSKNNIQIYILYFGTQFLYSKSHFRPSIQISLVGGDQEFSFPTRLSPHSCSSLLFFISSAKFVFGTFVPSANNPATSIAAGTAASSCNG